MKNITINFSFSEFYKKCLNFYKGERKLNILLSIITFIYLLNPDIPDSIHPRAIDIFSPFTLIILGVISAFAVFQSFGFIPILTVMGTIRAIVLHQFIAMFIFFYTFISLSAILAIYRTHQGRKLDSYQKSKEKAKEQEPTDFIEDRKATEKYVSRFK